MAQPAEHRTIEQAAELLQEHGLDGLAEVVALLLNHTMRIERDVHLRAAPYERTPERVDYANGYKDKRLKTRLGELALKVPQTRKSDFYPASLERGLRSERALLLAIAEMYVNGVSTRRVTKVVEELCGTEVSSTQVSRAAAELDEALEQWRSRPLGEYPYVILDARYEQVRVGGRVRDAAVLIACGVDAQGRRDVLGCTVSLSEAEVHWRQFLSDLKARGLHGIELITSDAHEGLEAARKAVFGSTPWQRCQFHLQQNAMQYVPQQAQRSTIAREIRTIFNAPDLEEAERFLDRFIDRHAEDMPKLTAWAEVAIPQGFAVFALPPSHRRRLRTSNLVERLNQEIRRRTRVARLFPNEDSCLRLVTAILCEIAEEWQTDGRRYLTFEAAQ